MNFLLSEEYNPFKTSNIKPLDRPPACWFHDVRNLITSEDSPELKRRNILQLIYAHRLIYSSDHKTLDMKFIWEQYTKQVNSLKLFLRCCYTLTHAERQLKAMERQQSNYNSKQECTESFETRTHNFENSYWTADLPDSFFDTLYKIKMEYQDYFYTAQPKDMWLHSCKEFWGKCRNLPIASMLLPILFTLFLTDNSDLSTVYARLKYKNRRLSIGAQQAVKELFKAVRDLVQEYIDPVIKLDGINDKEILRTFHLTHPKRVSFSPALPVFDWEKLEQDFLEAQDLSGQDASEVKKYLARYRVKNGLHKGEEKQLKDSRDYGENVRCLAKICNLNVFLIIKSTGKAPSNVKTAFQLLADGHLLHTKENYFPKNGDYVTSYRAYLKNYYDEIDLSHFGLFRYYRLPIKSDYDLAPWCLGNLQEAFEAAAAEYVADLCRRYKDEQFIKQQRLWDNTLERKEFVLGKKIAYLVTKGFTHSDYSAFISNTQHFDANGFPNYLEAYCRGHNIHDYKKIKEDEKAYTDYEVFSSLLQIIQTYLFDEFMTFWQETVSKALYGLSEE